MLAIYLGLMVTLLLAALDQTIVATALPRIVSDLGGITQYSWVFTAYMLTSTVTVPLYGRLGDVHGRRPLLLIAISIFLVGSALCGLAQGMTQLIVFRAIQGIGAGGLFPLSLAVIGVDRAAARPRPLAGPDRRRLRGRRRSSGPAVGGFIVDNTTWRWIFLVNLPVGARRARRDLADDAAARRARRALDRLARRRAALRRHGRAPARARLGRPRLRLVERARASARSSISAVVLLAVFALVERRAREPILPFELLRNPIVAGSVACMALVGMAMFGTIVYAPLFVQGVIGTTATSSGVVLTPLLLGAVTTSLITGPAHLAHRAATAGTSSSARSCSRSGWRSSGRWTCTRRPARRRATWSIAGHRDRRDDAGVRHLDAERRRARPDRLGDGARARSRGRSARRSA